MWQPRHDAVASLRGELYTVRRDDLKGKKYLETNARYYLGGVGPRNGVTGYREADLGGILEYRVYLELRRRGYRVAVGSACSRENCHFVAENPSGALFIRVAHRLENRETTERQLKAFSLLDDP